MSFFLIIEVNNNARLHEDLILRIPSMNFSIVADSYYYMLDNSDCNNNNNNKSIIFTKLLGLWRESLLNLQDGDILFLPFDFSDQYIGCLRFELISDNILEGCYGITQKILGMEINPSQLDQFDIEDSDFETEIDFFSINRSNLLSCIDMSTEKIKSNSI